MSPSHHLSHPAQHQPVCPNAFPVPHTSPTLREFDVSILAVRSGTRTYNIL